MAPCFYFSIISQFETFKIEHKADQLWNLEYCALHPKSLFMYPKKSSQNQIKFVSTKAGGLKLPTNLLFVHLFVKKKPASAGL